LVDIIKDEEQFADFYWRVELSHEEKISLKLVEFLKKKGKDSLRKKGAY